MYIATIRQKSETNPVPKAKTANVLENFTENLKRMKEDIFVRKNTSFFIVISCFFFFFNIT